MSADDHRALLRDSIRSFVARHGGRTRVRALRGSVPGYDRDHWGELADLGCISALIAPDLGGVGLELGDMSEMLQELAPGLGPEPVVPVAVGAVRLLSLVSDSPLAQRLLPEIASGRLVPALAWQEEGEELPAPGATSLVVDGDRAKLTGRKRFVMPARGDGYLVLAQSSDGPALCWVPTGAAGVSSTLETRVDGTPCAVVRFDDVAVDAPNRVTGENLTQDAIERVAGECNLCVAAELLGIAESALGMTLDHLRVREQFGKPIGAFQALQHRAVDLYVKQELARAALSAAIVAHAGSKEEAAIAAGRAKARAADSALAIAREAVQMHGAMGFADECDVGLHLKRALALSAWLGNATFHRARVERLYRAPAATASTAGASNPDHRADGLGRDARGRIPPARA